jgi:hypothetical protein
MAIVVRFRCSVNTCGLFDFFGWFGLQVVCVDASVAPSNHTGVEERRVTTIQINLLVGCICRYCKFVASDAE